MKIEFDYLNRLKSYSETICEVQHKDYIERLISYITGEEINWIPEYLEGTEGGIENTVQHMKLESKRDQQFVKLFKRKMSKQVNCDGCGMNPNEMYKIEPMNFFDLHHLKKFSSVKNKKHKIHEADFALLCPNCHRKIHNMMSKQNKNEIALSELRKEIKLSN